MQDSGWVAWREDREKVGLWRSEATASYGETKEEGNTLTCVGSKSVLLIVLLVEIPELTNVKHLTASEKAKLLSSQQYKTLLVQANENKER